MMTTRHSSLTKVGELFCFWEARKNTTQEWQGIEKRLWGSGVGAEVLWIQRGGIISWGRNANKTAALALKARNVISPPITKIPESHFSRVSSLSHAYKRSSYSTKNLKIANCEPIKLIIIYYFHLHLHEKNSIRGISHPHHPGKHNLPF